MTSRYIPQYKEHGVEPIHMPAREVPPGTKLPFASQFSNQRREAATAAVAGYSNVPYASPVAHANPFTHIPNIGNNVDWAAQIDSARDWEEDTSLDLNHPMIDNNFNDPNNWSAVPAMLPQPPSGFAPYKAEEAPTRPPLRIDPANAQTRTRVFKNKNYFEPPRPETTQASNPAVDEYVLMVMGEVIATGNLNDVQAQVSSLVLQEHPLSRDSAIPIDDIVVLKRMKIVAGVFIK